MTLKDSLVDIVRNSGMEILEKSVVLNMLSDYSAFKENHSYRFIYSTLQTEGIIPKLKLGASRNDKAAYNLSMRTGINQSLIQDVLDAIYYAYDNREGLSIAQYESLLRDKVEIEDTLSKGLNMSIDFGGIKVIDSKSFKISVYIFGDMASDIDVYVNVLNHNEDIICNVTMASFKEAYFAASEEVEAVCKVNSFDDIARIVVDAEGTGFSFLDFF